MLIFTFYGSVLGILRAYFEKCLKITVHLILKTRNCSLCSTMIEVAKEVDQNRYNLREKELQIAWQPEKARSGANSAFFRMVKLFNDCGLATIEIPAGKGAKKSLFKRLIVTRYGLSHKP